MKTIQKKILQLSLILFLSCVFMFIGKTNVHAISIDEINDSDSLTVPSGVTIDTTGSSTLYVKWSSSASWTSNVTGIYVILNYYDSNDKYLGYYNSYTNPRAYSSLSFSKTRYSTAAKYMAIVRTYQSSSTKYANVYTTSKPLYVTSGHTQAAKPANVSIPAIPGDITYTYSDISFQPTITMPSYTTISGVKDSSYRIFWTVTKAGDTGYRTDYSTRATPTFFYYGDYGNKYTMKLCLAAWSEEYGIWYKGATRSISISLPPFSEGFSQSVVSSSSSITVKWSAGTRACDGYHVYRYDLSKDSTSPVLIATLKNNVRSYTDKKSTAKVLYAYVVLPYSKSWGNYVTQLYISPKENFNPGYNPDLDSYHSKKAKQSAFGKRIPATSITGLTQSASGKKITWKKVASATGYVIYCKEKSASAYKAIKTIKDVNTLTYTDNRTLTAGKEYSYVVKAYEYIELVDLNLYSSFSAAKTIKAGKYAPATPAKPTLTNTTTGIKVSWSKAKNAVGYSIYRKTGSGKYAKLATISSGSTVSYVDKSAKNGYTYSYYIAAHSVSGTASGKAASRTYQAAPRKAIISESSATSLTVEWSRNNYATAYEIIVTDNGVSKTYTVKGKDQFMYTVTGLTNGNTATVKVRSYRTVGSTNVYSAWCIATR